MSATRFSSRAPLLRPVLVVLLAAAGAVPGAHGEQTRLEGAVVTLGRAPIEGARVEVLPDGGEATTDAEGRFTLPGVELPTTLWVSHAGHRPRTVDVVDSPAEPLVVVLEPGPVVREQMMVYADRLGERYSPRSVAASPVKPIELAAPPATLTDIATQVPGVSESGQGGLFQVVSLRGISGQRILNLIAGSRITSERRAGAATSFVDPELMEEVDVVRGPASTYYGSGALGGAIELYPRRFERLAVSLGYRDQGDHHHGMVGWGDGTFSLGLAHRQSGDTEAADGSRRFDRFDQWSGTFRADFGDGRLEHRVLLLPSYGSDIGKPNTDFPQETTIYPRERHLVGRYSVTSGERWRASLWGHPHDLVTRVDAGEVTDRVENDTFDFGGRFEIAPFDSGRRRYDGRFGVDWFGRRSVDAVERQFVDGALVDFAQPLDDGRQDEAAGYGVLNGAWGKVSAEVGARLTWVEQRNADLPSRDETAVSGFAGLGAELTERLRLNATVGTGLRVPTLSELFFTGTTGRGQVIGNPDLDPERSLSGEVVLSWASRRLFLSGGVFRNEIDDYIERVRITADLRTFRNLTSGTLEGLEVDGFYQQGGSWRIDWGGHWIDGESDGGEPLADVPPAQLRLGGRWSPGVWELESRLRWRSDRDADDLGPGEKAIPEAWLLDLSLARRFDGIRLALWSANLLDEEYFPSADEQAVLAVGRTVGVSLSFSALGR